MFSRHLTYDFETFWHILAEAWFCLLFTGRTMRIATATTPWLLPWMEINLYWGVRTTTKLPRVHRTTRLLVRLCSSVQTPVYSPCMASRPRQDPVPSLYQAVQSRCTITTPCTMTAYWTLCLLIWWILALKNTKPAQNGDREHTLFLLFFVFERWFTRAWDPVKLLRQGAKQTDWNSAEIATVTQTFNLHVFFNKWRKNLVQSGATSPQIQLPLLCFYRNDCQCRALKNFIIGYQQLSRLKHIGIIPPSVARGKNNSKDWMTCYDGYFFRSCGSRSC